MVQNTDFVTTQPRIKVVGVGGGGCNAVARMLKCKIRGVQFLCINTDAQALQGMNGATCFALGPTSTRGLGAGGNPELGRKAAKESREQLVELIGDADMVFIAAGMGGGTGTGAVPVMAEIAGEKDALAVAVVTKPFSFEGHRKQRTAEEGLTQLEGKVDTLIAIPNDRLLSLSGKKLSLEDAFKLADGVLVQGVQAISDIICVPGLINVDFADVKTIMSHAGYAFMAAGHSRGDSAATEAAREAISSPLTDMSLDGARRILFNITGGRDLTLSQVQEAANILSEAMDPEADVIFGVVEDPHLYKEVSITLIASGLPKKGGSPQRQEEALETLFTTTEAVTVVKRSTLRKRRNGNQPADHPQTLRLF